MLDENKDSARLKAWRQDNRKNGYVKKFDEDKGAYNVDDTKDERPPAWSAKDWDEHWKYVTGENLTGQVCASCGCSLTSSTRVGAHIRLDGESEDDMAWIALCCKSCNNSDQPQKVRKGSLIVRVKMSKIHKNVKPAKQWV